MNINGWTRKGKASEMWQRQKDTQKREYILEPSSGVGHFEAER
jgi:hypothetical protein